MASLATAFLAYRVRKRSHFLRSGLGIGCTYFLVIAGFQLTQSTPWRDALQLGFLGFLNALLIAVTSYLMLPVLEHFFDVVTDVTLLELSDLNHPLMRKMMVEAPGTYHHSLVVSSLAENACERIGANALLAKVGCYFHDIGKLEKPQFFTENQGYLYMNQHDDLPPRVSFEIIINHVRDGVRIARSTGFAAPSWISYANTGDGVVYYFSKGDGYGGSVGPGSGGRLPISRAQTANQGNGRGPSRGFSRSGDPFASRIDARNDPATGEENYQRQIH